MGASASELCYADAMRRVDPKLTRHARDLRNASTKAERMLWLRLRHYRPRFTRQLVIGRYIVDLACREARVAVELDGSQHADSTVDYDHRRTAFLQEQGWFVVRLWNNEVLENPDGAAELVLRQCASRLGSTHPCWEPGMFGEHAVPNILPAREGRTRQPRSKPA